MTMYQLVTTSSTQTTNETPLHPS